MSAGASRCRSAIECSPLLRPLSRLPKGHRPNLEHSQRRLQRRIELEAGLRLLAINTGCIEVSILIQRIIPMVSLLLALGVLCVLIAVSTSPAAETFRIVDSRIQYLRDVTQTLDQYLASDNRSANAEQVAAVS